MKNCSNLDGEVIEMKAVMAGQNASNYFDQDNFYPADGVVKMVAVSASQNASNYFDQDNFYPADGFYESIPDLKFDTLPSWENHSNLSGRWRGTILDKRERAKRRSERQKRKTARQTAKNEETKSRAELNRSLATEKPSDVEMAKALTAATSTNNTSDTTNQPQPLSKTLKITIGVGVAIALGVAGFIIYKRINK